MAICRNCGAECLENATFCTQCGTPITEGNLNNTEAPVYEAPVAPVYEAPTAPVYEAPVYEAPVYETPTAPAYTYTPYVAEASGSKVPAILGMIFGIVAVLLSLPLFVNMIDMVDYSRYYSIDDALGLFFGLSLFIIPAFVLGLIMSFKGTEPKGMLIAGRITSFVAIGFTAISFFMALSV